MAKLRVLPWQERLAKQGQRALVDLINSYDGRLRAELIRAAKEIDRILAALPGEGIGDTVRRAQYRRAQIRIAAIMKRLWSGPIRQIITEGVNAATAQLLKDSDRFLASLVRAAKLRGEKDLIAALTSDSASALEALRSRFLNSIRLSPAVYRNAAFSAGKIDRIINTGLAAGQSAREIAQAVFAFVNPSTPGGASYAALRLGRTEINNAYHALSIRGYNEQPWVEGVAWNISGSHPNGDECDELAEDDGFGLGPGIYPPDAVPFKPHPQCFCYTMTVTPSPDVFAERLLNGDYGDLAAA